MVRDDALVGQLTAGARELVKMALRVQGEAKHKTLGVHHWLLALVERHGPMAEAMARGLEASSLQRYLHEQLRQGHVGEPLAQESLVSQAVKRAEARGKQQATERDVAAVILTSAGYVLSAEPASSSGVKTAKGDPSDLSQSSAYRPRSKRPTPTLEQFGRDLTREALEGKLRPVVGRDAETQMLIETLCRQTKRNPCLVGPAGVGKTAIVEGFAQRVVRGDVPEMLRGVRVLAIQPSTLVAGAGTVGDLEERIKALLSEASQDGVVLFIDEVHSMIGAGGKTGISDVASLLKPALARGDMACIGATTDDEYRRFIESDSALERRFQPIRVQELTGEQTLHVLHTVLNDLAERTGVDVPAPILTWLVDFAQEYMHNRYFPDKAVDLLEQCIAHAVTQGKKTVEPTDAELVAYRMVGLPTDPTTRLRLLKERLGATALLSQEDQSALCNRLEVTMRGLDVCPARPNLVVLLAGNAAANSERLAEIIASTLFGADDRVVTVDLSRFVHPADLTMLLGAPPGYVGYNEALPIHRIAQMASCVVRFENLHACHPIVREVLKQALADGFLTDACGKRIYLSDTVVLFTAEVGLQDGQHLGFALGPEPSGVHWRRAAEQALGMDLLSQIDVVCTEVPITEGHRRKWLEEDLLASLSQRYRKLGLHLQWDESVVRWLLSQHDVCAGRRDWERLVDSSIAQVLVKHLPASGQARREVKLRILREGEYIVALEERPTEEGG